MVEFNLDAQGYLTKMAVTPKSGQISGVLKEIGSVDAYKLLKEITVTLKDGKDYKFYVRLDNNLKNSTIDNLKVGNTINAYTNYRFIGDKRNIVGNNYVYGTISYIKTDNRNNVIGVTIKEESTNRELPFDIANNSYLNGQYYLNGLRRGDTVLVENNGYYATSIKNYSNNTTNDSAYSVYAYLRNDISSNTKNFEITRADLVAGPQVNGLVGKKFDVTGLNLPNNAIINQSYKFIIEIDSRNNIRPIMIINYNNGYGYGYGYGYIR